MCLKLSSQNIHNPKNYTPTLSEMNKDDLEGETEHQRHTKEFQEGALFGEDLQVAEQTSGMSLITLVEQEG